MAGDTRQDETPERTRVVVTGLGATTALGGDVASTWAAMLRGENGIRRLDDQPWAATLPTQIGGVARVEPDLGLAPLQRVRLSRTAQLAVTAASEAWIDAGLDAFPVTPHRVAVIVATAMVDMTALINGWEALKDRGFDRVPPLTASWAMGNAAAAAVSMAMNARAGAVTAVSACSSGAQALATAADNIRRGVVDVAVAGGAEAPLHPLVLASFAAMRALSRRVDEPAAASRPFDAERDGMVLGEGAGILVLESEAHARERGARIYGELAGVGISSDAYDMVRPEPNGAGTVRAVQESLADAGLSPADVAHLNANGVATAATDAAEARAVRRVFGDAGTAPAVTANKSMIGHCMGAAGAVESITTVLSLHHGMVPPTRNFTALDQDLSIEVVHGAPLKLDGGQTVAVKLATGFGGHNVALTFRAAGSRPPFDSPR
jgi:3-oxoacyl-[acyl-carrier-protein] synthase II